LILNEVVINFVLWWLAPPRNPADPRNSDAVQNMNSELLFAFVGSEEEEDVRATLMRQ